MAQTPVTGLINSNTTWTVANSPYELTADVTVATGVTLTIEPGVQVFFSANDDLFIEGTLSASGTVVDSIRFSGETTWDGRVELRAGSNATFNHAVFSDMGNTTAQAALTVLTTGFVTINNSRFVDNRHGIFVNAVGAFPTISNTTVELSNQDGITVFSGSLNLFSSLIDRNTNMGIVLEQAANIQSTTISNNGSNANDSGIHIDAAVAPTLVNNTFTNNFIDVLTHPEITNDTIFDTNGLSEIVLAFENITTNTTWHQPVLPESWNFRMFNNVIVDPAVTLTIEPGVEVIFAAGSDLSIDGTLNAVGTMADSIRFSGINTFDGEVILNAGSTADIDYVVFSDMADNSGNAALAVATTATVDVANSRFVRNNNGILVVSGASPTITNTTIENSLRNGINVNGGSTMTLTNSLIHDNGDKGIRLLSAATIQNNTISDNGFNNEDCGVHIDAAVIPILDNNIFSGNAIDVITHPEIMDDEIFDTNGLTQIVVDNKSIGVNTTWQKPVLPENWNYRLLPDVTVDAGFLLTIEPGVEIIMMNNGELLVDGTLNAIGTVSDSIRFTGLTTYDGEVWLRSGSSATIDYVVFDELGGGSATPALTVSTANTVSIDNSRFVRNRNGVRVEDGGAVTITSTSIELNNRDGISVVDGSMTLTNSLIDRNSSSGVTTSNIVNITNNVFSGNLGNGGLFIFNPVEPVLENNVFSGNSIDVLTHPQITSEDVFDTNGLSEIHINGTFLTADATWEKPTLPEDWDYMLVGDVDVPPGLTLTIDPGVNVFFSVNEDLLINGTLNAIGTVSDSIRFIGESLNDGVVRMSSGSDGAFDYVVFENMGDDAGFQGQHALSVETTGAVTVNNSRFFDNRNAVRVVFGGSPSITNTLFESNKINAVSVLDGNILIDNCNFLDNFRKGVFLEAPGAIQNSSFTENGFTTGDAAIHIASAVVPTIDGNTFSDNIADLLTHPEIMDDELFDNNGLTEILIDNQNITANTTWQEPVAPEDWTYRMLSDVTVDAGVTLTIEPGVSVSFGAGDDLLVNGTLNAIGINSNVIKFIGETTSDGGVEFLAGSSGNIDFTRFIEMGDNTAGREHALYINSSTVSVSNSIFEEGSGGIKVSNGVSPAITSVTLRSNDAYGIFVEDGSPTITDSRILQNDIGIGIASGSPSITLSCVFGNTTFGIENTGLGTVDGTNNWWGDATGPTNASLNPGGSGDNMSAGVNFAPFNTVECTVIQSPPTVNFDAQPTNETICEQENGSFWVTVSGDTGFTYQWQEDQGSGFVDLVNSALYSGVDTDSLQIINAPDSLDGVRYRCRVTGSIAEEQISTNGRLFVFSLPPDPVLTFSDSSLCGPGNIDLLASGLSEGVYHWYDSDTASVPLLADSGGTFSTGTITSDTTFYVSISETCETPRFPIQVNIVSLPTITSQPLDASLAEGEDLDLVVAAAGGDLSYQWQKDGIDVPTGTAATLSLINLALGDAGDYTCIISNSCGVVTSIVATVTVVADPIPEFTLSILEDVTPVEVTGSVDLGQTEVSVDLTRDFEIENIGSVTISVVDITSDNSNFSVINIPSSIAPAATETFGIVFNSSFVTTDAAIMTVSFVDSVFTVNLTAESTPPLPVITVDTPPVDALICEGEDAAFNLAASGDFGLAYQWQENQGSGFSDLTDSGIYSGVTTNTLLLTDPPASNDGFEYRCIISGFTALDVISDTSSLTFNVQPPDPAVTFSDTTICTSTSINLLVSGTSTGSYVWYESTTASTPILTETSGILATGLISNDTTFYVSILEACESNRVPINVNVTNAPVISSQPVDLNRNVGEDATFTVVASGSNLSYQWQKDGVDIPTETAASLSLLNLTLTDAGDYSCVITNPCGSVTSQQATLAVAAMPSPEFTLSILEDATLIQVSGSADMGQTEVMVDLSREFTIENTGTSTITVSAILSSDPNFSITNPPTSIDPSISASFDVVFNSNIVGRDTTTLEIQLPDSTFTIQLFAEAITPVPEFTLSIIENTLEVEVIGTTDLGQTAVLTDLQREFVIENTGGSAISVTDILSSNPNFIVQNVPSVIDVASSVTFEVVFNTADPGQETATITIQFQGSDFTFEVTAAAIEEDVTLSIVDENQQVEVGSTVDLGETEVQVDLTSDFVIENGGSDPIVVEDITSSNPNFVVTNIPDQIDPQSSETFNVTFNRSQQGRDSTTLRITTQDAVYTIEVFAEATQELSSLIIYNAVAPNGDGKHEWFKIENIEQYPNNTVEIFNRWGDRVFETANYDNDDPNRRFEGARNIGSADGDLVEGTYFYLIDLKNNTNPQSGYLLLKR